MFCSLLYSHGFRVYIKIPLYFPEAQFHCKLMARFHLSILSRSICQYLLESGNKGIILLALLEFPVLEPLSQKKFFLKESCLKATPTQSHHTDIPAFWYRMAKYLPESLPIALGIQPDHTSKGFTKQFKERSIFFFLSRYAFHCPLLCSLSQRLVLD